MTETTDKKKLPAVVERFILHWGDMGDEWGVNRSVSQIHGLLYLAEARIAAGRKEREIDPAVDALRACVSDAADDPTISPVASKRLKEMLAFTELVDRWYTQMLNVPRPRLVALIKLGEKIVSFLPAGKVK